MNRIAAYINRHIDGVAFSDQRILEPFSGDRSPLRFLPRVLVFPSHTADLVSLVRFSAQLAQRKLYLPITVRGGGTSHNGAPLGEGMLISTKNLHHIKELDLRQRLVRVEAGITLGALNQALATHGLFLPVLGHENATIGGLIATCAPASDNTTPATIIDSVSDLEVVLANGELAHFSNGSLKKALSQNNAAIAPFLQNLDHTLKQHQEALASLPSPLECKAHYPGLFYFKDGKSFPVSALFAGSEGSLGLISEVILRLEPVFSAPSYLAIPCASPQNFTLALQALKDAHFTDLKLFDRHFFNQGESNGKDSSFFRSDDGQGYVLIASAKDDTIHMRRRKLKRLTRTLPGHFRLISATPGDKLYHEFERTDSFVKAYLNDNNAGLYHFPILEGIFIPPDQQAKFLSGLGLIAKRLKLNLPVTGRPDFDLFSLHPAFNITSASGRNRLIEVASHCLTLVTACQGHLCGASPEGRFHALFIKNQATANTIQLEKAVKQSLDPKNIFNPYLKSAATNAKVLSHLRTAAPEGPTDLACI